MKLRLGQQNIHLQAAMKCPGPITRILGLILLLPYKLLYNRWIKDTTFFFPSTPLNREALKLQYSNWDLPGYQPEEGANTASPSHLLAGQSDLFYFYTVKYIGPSFTEVID